MTGQDGSYQAEFLLDKGYEVCRIIRRASTERFARIEHLGNHVRLLQGDLLDQTSLLEAVEESQPEEVYNLAAQSLCANILEPTCSHGRVYRLRCNSNS